MAPPDLRHLHDQLAERVASLPDVSERRMFGCDGFFARDNIFGLIWKEGRMGLKLPDPEQFEALMSQPGAAPWKAGDRTMAHWVFVPESMHEDPAALEVWVRRAHALAVSAETPPRPRRKKA